MARRLAAARVRDPSLPSTALEAVERARAGHAPSLEFLRETAEYLAIGVANLVFILDLERVVLGTIAAGARELILDPLRAALARRLWPPFLERLEIAASALWPDLGDYAALAVARDLPSAL
jgi:glucokinase